MKRALVVVLLSAVLLTGCSDEVQTEPNVSVQTSYFNLVADKDTGILYISNRVNNANGNSFYIYTPYYSEHGKLCKYDDNRIVEVE